MIYTLFLILLMTSQVSFSMSWLFGTKSKSTVNNWAEFQEHIKHRKNDSWKTEFSDVRKPSLDITFKRNIASEPYGNQQFKTNTTAIHIVRNYLNYLPQKYKKIRSEKECENFYISFENYQSNTPTLDPKSQTILDVLNNTAEVLYEESDEKRTRADQLNIIKSELDNVIMNIEKKRFKPLVVLY